MNILITGGAGFIGSHLSEKLVQQGDDVTIIDNLSTGKFKNIKHLTKTPTFHFAIETIMNETVMDRLVSECDVIVHLAAAVGVELVVHNPVHTIETNVLGTDVVLRTANRYRKKVLIASTSEIYGKGVNEAFGENDDRLMGPNINNRWSYACSKSLDEFLALAYYKEKDLPTVICRFFNTVGVRQTGQYGMVVPRFIRQALRNEPLTVFGDGKQSRCFCNVRDTVKALNILIKDDKTNGEIFNIGNTEQITIYELAERIITLCKSRSEIKIIPYNEAYEEGFEDMQRRKPDISKIQKAINWKPTYSLNETLEEIINFEKNEQKQTV